MEHEYERVEELDGALCRLCTEFPDVPRDAIASVLGDSFQTVVEASGQPLVDRGEALARIRLEVRTGHQALTASGSNGPTVRGDRR